MNNAEFQLRGIGDPRLAVHATSALPAWLWTVDGTRVLWANPVGAKLFGAASSAALAKKIFGPADAHRRQVARLAGRLPSTGAIRMERLRGFGARPGMLATCGCARLDFADGSQGILVAAAETVGRTMPLAERLQRLVEGIDSPIAAFARDGMLVAASDTARPLLGFRNLSDAGLDDARGEALQQGRAETPFGIGHMVLQRVGAGADVGLVALIAPGTTQAAHAPHVVPELPQAASAEPANHPVAPAADRPMPYYEQPAASGEAPAEFALIDEFEESPAAATPDTAPAEPADEPVAPAADRPMPDYEQPAASGEAPAEFALMGEYVESPLDAATEHSGEPPEQTLSVDNAQTDLAQDSPAAELPTAPAIASSGIIELHDSIAVEASQQTNLEMPVETPKNVLPFRPIGETKSPALTPVENSAFNELARQLSARLESENGTAAATPTTPDAVIERQAAPKPAGAQPDWLTRPEPPAHGETRRDKMLLDLLPVGVLIYRLDRLLYANPAFLLQMGYPSVHALEEAGGLDALYVEPGVSTASSTSDTGTPVTISANQASTEHAPPSGTDARLFTISWDDDSALALIFSGARTESAGVTATMTGAIPASEPSGVGHANAEELGAILDTAAEGIVMFDAKGNINACNRSAEALFGYDGAELVQRNLADLFAPESQRVVKEYLQSIKGADIASLLDHGRDVLGRVRAGDFIPLSMTMGRTRPDGPNFFAVFRDLSQSKASENELRQARRLADRAANAKADMLARISHEVRTPLNAIIGFAEVMIGERFGTLGNARYVEYMKDIRASGERVIAIINDLLDLSRIETGKLDLAFANQNLNNLVEQCVAVMQPQANRERIIIRTSLAHALPPVVADARALRQITLNLIGNSIHLANAGGQVIVSTALSDFGEVMLRVRDTGHGLNENEVAAAMEPFRTQPPSDQAFDSSGVSLSLTKALVEANRAQFHIKTGPHSGTLIEVVFLRAMARA
jgi:PAS domain S-box-containing protein